MMVLVIWPGRPVAIWRRCSSCTGAGAVSTRRRAIVLAVLFLYLVVAVLYRWLPSRHLNRREVLPGRRGHVDALAGARQPVLALPAEPRPILGDLWQPRRHRGHADVLLHLGPIFIFGAELNSAQATLRGRPAARGALAAARGGSWLMPGPPLGCRRRSVASSVAECSPMSDPAPLMAGKKGLIMGIANERSLAFGIARALAAQGAELAITYQGEVMEKRVRPLALQLGARARPLRRRHRRREPGSRCSRRSRALVSGSTSSSTRSPLPTRRSSRASISTPAPPTSSARS